MLEYVCTIKGYDMTKTASSPMTDSRYNMWRAIFAVAHADNVISPEEEKFAVFYQKDQRLIAVDAINSPKEFVTGKKLIERQTEIPLELLQDMNFDLKEMVR